jgi:hypothetical protein
MSKEMYQVLDQAGRSMGYYEATSKGQAKKAVIAGLTVKKLSGQEIHSVYKNGYGVSDVQDGKIVFNGDVGATDDSQPDLPLDEAQASAG